MTAHSTPEADDASTIDSLTDPAVLRDRDNVEYREETETHDDRDHCATETAGRAIVGVTDDDRVLLVEHAGPDVALLPVGTVELGEDWAVVARETVAELTSLAVDLDAAVLVREQDHYVEGDEEPHTTTRDVVFRASVSDGETGAADPGVDESRLDEDRGVDADELDAAWHDEVPENVPPGLAGADVRLFFD